MKARDFVLFGAVAALLLVLGTIGLALLVPGYSHVRQSVSEIGEVGSPAQLPFTLLLCSISMCIALFAWGIRGLAQAANHSAFAAYVVGCMAISTAGVGIFSYPHPLHNVFGLSELIGYQAPLAMALTWRRHHQANKVVGLSWVMFAIVWAAIAVNLIPVFRPPVLWPQIRPVFGLIQRALFAAWFAWSAGVGIMLWACNPRTQSRA